MITQTLKRLTILVLMLAASMTMVACDNEEAIDEALKEKVEAYTNATSYTMDFTMKLRNDTNSIEIINKVENNKEYVSFSGEEYYQQFNTGTMVRYFKDEDTGEWDKRVIQLQDEPAKGFISPDNIDIEWFTKGDGGYYVLDKDHHIDMFGEANENSIDIATIRTVDEGLEVAYSFRKTIETSTVTFDYTAIIHSFNETTIDLPVVGTQ